MDMQELERLVAEQMRQSAQRIPDNLYLHGTPEPRVIRRQGIQQRWEIPIGDEIRIDDRQTLIIPRK